MTDPRPLTDLAIVLDPRDTVATALADVPAGTYRLGPDGAITLAKCIPAGFKIAVARIPAGEKVYKYGHVIGLATQDIEPGECVHVRNLASQV